MTELLVGEVAVATATTTLVASSTNANTLITALIGFGVSLVTMAGGELIKFIVAYLKKKTKDIDLEDEEKDE